jgi:hypothetical protein
MMLNIKATDFSEENAQIISSQTPAGVDRFFIKIVLPKTAIIIQ